VPVITLKDGGRHTRASLARDAEVDPEIRRKTLGHADAPMTSHYTHIEAQAHRAAAEAVAKLVEGTHRERLFYPCSNQHRRRALPAPPQRRADQCQQPANVAEADGNRTRLRR
jgi:hypothetical protein